MLKFKLKKQEFHPTMLLDKYLISDVGSYIKIYKVTGKDNIFSKQTYADYRVEYVYLDAYGNVVVSDATFYAIESRLKDGRIKYVSEEKASKKLREWQYSM